MVNNLEADIEETPEDFVTDDEDEAIDKSMREQSNNVTVNLLDEEDEDRAAVDPIDDLRETMRQARLDARIQSQEEVGGETAAYTNENPTFLTTSGRSNRRDSSSHRDRSAESSTERHPRVRDFASSSASASENLAVPSSPPTNPFRSRTLSDGAPLNASATIPIPMPRFHGHSSDTDSMAIGPMTPRNDAGPFVFGGSGGVPSNSRPRNEPLGEHFEADGTMV